MKLTVPIGLKIIILLMFAIGIGLGAYFWTASRLMISDKVSYLYDYTHAQAKLASIEYQAHPEAPKMDQISRRFHIRIVNVDSRKVVYLSHRDENPLVPLPIDDILQGTSEQMSSGAREVNDYIVAYQLTAGGKDLVLAYIPTSVAFESVRTLQIRSVYGALCIFIFLIGLSSLISKGISMRLKGLVEATEEVSSGNFGVQVDEKSKITDEVSLLGSTFNLMSKKISELMQAKEKQVRMEKELETAELLQSKFFPNERIERGEYRVEGQSWFASECGGDYWQHANLDPYLITVMGDVTGHGASAALVTALVHGVFTSTVRTLKHMSLQDPVKDIVTPIITNIHHSLKGSAGENATFTCLLSVIDTRTQKMYLQNAGNPFPYIYREETRKFESIKSKNTNPLGDIDPTLDPKVVDLKKGDRVYFYTDGLFDVRLTDNEKMAKKEYFEDLARRITADPGKASSNFIQNVTSVIVDNFFGKDRANRPDDITIVVIEKT